VILRNLFGRILLIDDNGKYISLLICYYFWKLRNSRTVEVIELSLHKIKLVFLGLLVFWLSIYRNFDSVCSPMGFLDDLNL
jgi:hypothetical protein